MVLGGARGPGFFACDAAALCVAVVALGDIHLRFTWQLWHKLTWQLWHKLTSTVVLRGRRDTYGIGWRPWAWFCRPWRRGCLRGRRGTWWHPPSFHVAGVAQSDIHGRFAWQAWHLWYWGGALGPSFVACDAAVLCVAGVALGFTWQAWHNLTSTVVLRGRRGTYGTGWRAWARICRLWRRGCLRGRRGTWWHPPSFHVAAVAQTHIHGRFARIHWTLPSDPRWRGRCRWCQWRCRWRRGRGRCCSCSWDLQGRTDSDAGLSSLPCIAQIINSKNRFGEGSWRFSRLFWAKLRVSGRAMTINCNQSLALAHTDHTPSWSKTYPCLKYLSIVVHDLDGLPGVIGCHDPQPIKSRTVWYLACDDHLVASGRAAM